LSVDLFIKEFALGQGETAISRFIEWLKSLFTRKPEPESKPFKPRVEPGERFTRLGDWENVNSPKTYRLLTEARDYFLIKGVIKRRDPRLA